MAEQIQIAELSDVLNRLKNNQTEFNFIGINSNGIDCLYIMLNDDGLFHIEYEAMSKTPYIEKIRCFAVENNYSFLMTTYGNKPHFSSQESAPVIRIENKMQLEEIATLAGKMQKEIFGNDEFTMYEIVP